MAGALEASRRTAVCRARAVHSRGHPATVRHIRPSARGVALRRMPQLEQAQTEEEEDTYWLLSSTRAPTAGDNEDEHSCVARRICPKKQKLSPRSNLDLDIAMQRVPRLQDISKESDALWYGPRTCPSAQGTGLVYTELGFRILPRDATA